MTIETEKKLSLLASHSVSLKVSGYLVVNVSNKVIELETTGTCCWNELTILMRGQSISANF